MTNAIRNRLRLGAISVVLGLGASPGWAADPPRTSEVLNKLHESDQREIDAGNLAQKNGQSKAVQDYGKMLVKDHSAADKKVAALAKHAKVDLGLGTSGGSDMNMKAGASFDAEFAQHMVDDHKKDIAEVTLARNQTDDPKLKKLLSDLLPTLQKHQEAAQKILDSQIEP